MIKYIGWSVMGIATLLLSACGGGGGGGSRAPAVTESVPAAVSSDVAAAVTYLSALSAVPASTADSLEPVTVPDTVASNDTEEPSSVAE